MRSGRRLLEAIGLGRLVRSHREHLAFRYLTGVGIEIGALASPLRVPSSAHVRYVDNVEKSENERKFAELDAGDIVAPDILTDGFTLETIPDATLDFVIANHVLEHAPDPIGVLRNWLRVLRQGGVVYSAVPLALGCFDRGREITSLAHMIDDHRLAREDSCALLRKNDAPYREWLTISEPNVMKERGTPQSPLAGEELMRRVARMAEERAEIHFHTFSPTSYEALWNHVLSETPGRLEELSVASNGFEAIGIVRRHWVVCSI